jgi:hypothetical protein
MGGTCNNSNAGTSPSAPWCTLTKALQTLTAGQLALVRTGTYNNGNIRPTNSGTPGNYITFRAYPGNTPVINCSGQTFCFDGNAALAKSYIVFDGFEIANPVQQYMVCRGQQGCHHWWFVNNKVHNNGATFDGFVMGGHHLVFSNNEIYNTGREGLITLVPPDTGNNIILEFNHVHDNGRNADDAGGLKCGDVDAFNCIMRYNVVHDNYRNPGSSFPCFNPGQCQGVTGLYIDRGRDTEFGGMSYIYNNIVFNNDIGIQAYDTHGVRIFNNIIYENGFTPGAGIFIWHFSAGIAVGDSNSNTHIYNNTIIGNAGRGIDLWNIGANAVTMTNNIVQGNVLGQMYYFGGQTNFTSNYNLVAAAGGGPQFDWNGTTYTLTSFKARSGNTMELNSQGSSATFVNAATDDYHLTTGSVGKDQGTTIALFSYDKDNVTRPQNSVWDIGAYEFGAGVTLIAPTNLRIVP